MRFINIFYLTIFISSIFFIKISAQNLYKLSSFDMKHNGLLKKANKNISEVAKKAQADPLYPQFHLQTGANWINDPNGPIYFNDEYHMFFQHNPYGDKWGNMSWGHAVSKDFVFREHLPIALTPNPDSYDEGGIFSGSCVIDNGIPTIIYTSVLEQQKDGSRPETQSIARSYDDLRSWMKFKGNPVIVDKPRNDLTGFRDPFVWKSGDVWNMVLGSGIKGVGGTALLSKSKDMESWEYAGPICTGFGEMWECPNFFPLGDKWVLAVSPYGELKYAVGEFQNDKFYPDEWRRMDLGGREGFYAPNCMLTPEGRRVMWGWITGGGTENYPWNGMLSVPRILTLRKDGRLGMRPAEALEKLRGRYYGFENIILQPEKKYNLAGLKGDCLEIIVEFDIRGTREVGIELLVSSNGEEKTTISYDNQNLLLKSGDKQGSFRLLTEEHYLKLHIFLDKSVVEVFANYRECLTVRAYPASPDSKGIRLFSKRREAEIISMDIWEVNSIWIEN